MELEERYDGSTSQGLRPPTIARVVPEGRLGMRVEVVQVVHRVLSWVMAADPRPSTRSYVLTTRLLISWDDSCTRLKWDGRMSI